MSIEDAVVELGNGMSRVASAINELLDFIKQGARADGSFPAGETAALVGVKNPGRGRPKKEDAPAPASAAQAAPLTDRQEAAGAAAKAREEAVARATVEPAASADEVITVEAIRAACAQHAKEHGGKDAVLKVLKGVGGVGKVVDLPADKFPAVYAALIGSAVDGDF